MPYEFVSLKPATGDKKYAATIKNKTTGREKTIKFGAKGYTDYTKGATEEQKKAYLTRHKARENWSDPTTAGFWAKHVLWNEKSVAKSLAQTKSKYF
jgi:hypothetical protein